MVAILLLLTPTQRCMLEYMGYAGGIRRIGFKSDGEDIVPVISGDVKKFSACLLMMKMVGSKL